MRLEVMKFLMLASAERLLEIDKIEREVEVMKGQLGVYKEVIAELEGETKVVEILEDGGGK